MLLQILAGAGALAFAVVGLGAAVVFWTDWQDRRESRRQLDVDARLRTAREEFAAGLRADAAWFAEDPPTRTLLEGLAAGRPIAGLREEWRKTRGPFAKACG